MSLPTDPTTDIQTGHNASSSAGRTSDLGRWMPIETPENYSKALNNYKNTYDQNTTVDHLADLYRTMTIAGRMMSLHTVPTYDNDTRSKLLRFLGQDSDVFTEKLGELTSVVRNLSICALPLIILAERGQREQVLAEMIGYPERSITSLWDGPDAKSLKELIE